MPCVHTCLIQVESHLICFEQKNHWTWSVYRCSQQSRCNSVGHQTNYIIRLCRVTWVCKYQLSLVAELYGCSRLLVSRPCYLEPLASVRMNIPTRRRALCFIFENHVIVRLAFSPLIQWCWLAFSFSLLGQCLSLVG